MILVLPVIVLHGLSKQREHRSNPAKTMCYEVMVVGIKVFSREGDDCKLLILRSLICQCFAAAMN